MTGNIASVVAVAAILLFGLYLLGNQASLDIAGPLRDRLWQHDARKIARRGRYPDSLERAYWTRKEYDRDSARLHELGYSVASENAGEGFVELPDLEVPGRDPFASWRRGRPPARRRIPRFFVIYEHADVSGTPFRPPSGGSSTDMTGA